MMAEDFYSMQIKQSSFEFFCYVLSKRHFAVQINPEIFYVSSYINMSVNNVNSINGILPEVELRCRI